MAFDHPNSNIITRSLGDPRGKAKPDTKEFDIYDGDIVMLCSDGLCGCLRDNEIETIIAQQTDSLQECRDALWDADEAAGWHDNVTIVMAQILSGGASAIPQPSVSISSSKAKLLRKNKYLKITLASVVGVLLACIAYIVWNRHSNIPTKVVKEDLICDSNQVAQLDTIVQDTIQIVKTTVHENGQKVRNTSKESVKKEKTDVLSDTIPQPDTTSVQEESLPELTPIIDNMSEEKRDSLSEEILLRKTSI